MMIDAATIAGARAFPIEDELARRGIKLRGAVERSGPCPVCGGADRFNVNVRKQIFNCRGCQRGGDVIAMVELLDGCGFGQTVETLVGESPRKVNHAPREQPRQSAEDYEKRQAAKASYLWRHRWPIAGSPAERYLRAFAAGQGRAPSGDVAAFSVGEPRDVTSVHLTLLPPDGSGKADAKPNKLRHRGRHTEWPCCCACVRSSPWARHRCFPQPIDIAPRRQCHTDCGGHNQRRHISAHCAYRVRR